VTSVWFGNEDNTPTNNMTGGTLPAMAWHEVMAFAHQNADIKPIPYLGPDGIPVAALPNGAVQAAKKVEVVATGSVPGTLSRRSFEVIDGIGALFRKLEPPAAPRASLPSPTQAAANMASDAPGSSRSPTAVP
jgi:penicillin-binding protein 1A